MIVKKTMPVELGESHPWHSDEQDPEKNLKT
jgi:hypothetical protein